MGWEYGVADAMGVGSIFHFGVWRALPSIVAVRIARLALQTGLPYPAAGCREFEG